MVSFADLSIVHPQKKFILILMRVILIKQIFHPKNILNLGFVKDICGRNASFCEPSDRNLNKNTLLICFKVYVYEKGKCMFKSSMHWKPYYLFVYLKITNPTLQVYSVHVTEAVPGVIVYNPPLRINKEKEGKNMINRNFSNFSFITGP